MPRLAVIPSDPLTDYQQKGTASWLQEYYNPTAFFDQVFLLSPLENQPRFEFGMRVVPTNPREFKSRLRELQIDVVRAYGGYWACDLACENKLENVPVIVSVHDTNPQLLHDLIAEADVVLTVSNVVRELVLKKFKWIERVWVLPNRVNFEIMRPYPMTQYVDLSEKYPFRHKILHVGRKSPQKNLDTVIKALSRLGEDYCLIAVGRGDTSFYRSVAERAGVISRCFFVDAIPNPDLARYYSFADCVCNPSRWEGFGLIFIEALACEAVIVTSDLAPMSEYIHHRENGFLVQDYEDPGAMARAIETVCLDADLRAAMKNTARKSVSEFDKAKVDRREAGYYEKTLEMRAEGQFKGARGRGSGRPHSKLWKFWPPWSATPLPR